MHRPILTTTLLAAMFVTASIFPAARAADDQLPQWPAQTKECRPWCYNWWLGSAVDRENLSRELQRYHDGGLGGIHIIPIYGAKGAESRYIDYLSPKWMEMLAWAVSEAQRLDMGVDMTTGTGWCFGGPDVSAENGCWQASTQTFDIPAGGKLPRLDRARVQAIVAVGSDGQRTDLKPLLNDQSASWKAPGAGCKVYVLNAVPKGPAVKRAAPGGGGRMLNPISPAAIAQYLKRFDEIFSKPGVAKPRSMYHDSYEYRSTWAPELPEAFAKRRGYRLEDKLEALCAEPKRHGADDNAARVRCDYNETISDLMIEESFPLWFKWCREHGMLTRDQAHGSPAVLLDLYAQADIPETEMFGHGTRDPLVSRFDERFGEGDRNPLISKMASSAAHVAGRKLTSSETGTWLAEHFCETLEEIKCLEDLLMVCGINHIFYHGTCYSPDDAAWPGWLFYASTEMNPRNAIWHDAPTLNAYVARCQSVLQSGRPDNDVLLYWPIHDFWHDTTGLAPGLTVHSRGWLEGQSLGQTARALWDRGYGFDYISDRQVASASAAESGAIAVPGGNYRVILVPPAKLMPLPTLQKLADLASQGCAILFQDALPQDVPGAGDLPARRQAMKKLLAEISLQPAGDKLQRAAVGKGQILVGDLEAMLKQAGVAREAVVDQAGVKFIRRAIEDGCYYFIVNQSTKALDGDIALATPAASAAIMDPMTGATGVAKLHADASGKAAVYLRVEPGNSIILRTYRQKTIQGPAFAFAIPGAAATAIPGPWKVQFIAGGPALPKTYETPKLESWTKNGDPAAEAFGGTAVYSTTFDAPAGNGPWVLDLGEVCHSARVRLNGQDRGTLIMHPYRLLLDNLKPQGNTLEIEVTNLSANRIRDLDRRKVVWRIFNEINLVNIGYKPFDASKWPVFDSGLLGPVTLRAQ